MAVRRAPIRPLDPAERHAVHPVLEILLARRARGDRPESRGDPHRVALAIEGGGSRATISGGMVLGLYERGLAQAFDVVHGASAGSVNGAWFVSGAPQAGIAAWYRPGVMRRVTALGRMLVGQPLVDMRWVTDELYERIVPLDWGRVLTAATPLHPLATDAQTGAIVDLHDLITDVTTLKTAVRASTHLPLLGGPAVALGGRRFLDAALAETLPFRTPLAQGATHVVLLRTRRADDPPRAPWRSGDALARVLLRSGGPGLAEAWRTRHARQLADEAWLTDHPDTVLAIRPPAGSPDVAQRATDETLLRTAVGAGARAVYDLVPPREPSPAREPHAVVVEPVLRTPSP
jgi:predicted patatin/cPLA2 family phospholipase